MDKILTIQEVKNSIFNLRGKEVILASDVAKFYGVETRIVNQAVKNNPDKFPNGYIMDLSKDEWSFLRSKILTLENHPGKGHYPKYLPKAFTEKGLYMLATILKSPIATQTTLAIIDTFAQVRELKRTLKEMHDSDSTEKKKKGMIHVGEILAELITPELETSETESSMEINLFIGKLKHTVKRSKRNDHLKEKLEQAAERLLERGFSIAEIKEIFK